MMISEKKLLVIPQNREKGLLVKPLPVFVQRGYPCTTQISLTPEHQQQNPAVSVFLFSAFLRLFHAELNTRCDFPSERPAPCRSEALPEPAVFLYRY